MQTPTPPDRPFILGADVIRHLTPMRHPMIMVDRITHYGSVPQLAAEKCVSANEPTFAGHFPDLKIWPGILTIEGLRQCCLLLEALQKLDEAGFLDDLKVLQNRQTLRPGAPVSEELAGALDGSRALERLPMKVRVKLLAPVFAGSVIEYQVDDQGAVQAQVEGQLVAKGVIECQNPAG